MATDTLAQNRKSVHPDGSKNRLDLATGDKLITTPITNKTLNPLLLNIATSIKSLYTCS